MSDDTLLLKGESSSLVKAVKDAQTSILNYHKVMSSTIQTITKYNKAGEKVSVVIQGITKDQLKVAATVKKGEKGWAAHTVTVKDNSAALAENARIQAASAKKAEQASEKRLASEKKLQAQLAASNRRASGTASAVGISVTAGVDTSTATVAEKQSHNATVARLQDLVQQHKISYAESMRVWDKTSKGANDYRGAIGKIQLAVDKVKDAEQNLGNATRAEQKKNLAAIVAANAKREKTVVATVKKLTVAEKQLANAVAQQQAQIASARQAQAAALNSVILGSNKATASTKKHVSEVQNMKAAMGEVINSWQFFGRMVAVQLAHQAVAALVNSLREGVTTTIELSKAVAEIQTISQQAKLTNDEWVEGARSLSDSWGIHIGDQFEAIYQTVSNQVAQGHDAIDFVNEANKLAVAGRATVAESVNLMSSAVNSYNLDFQDAAGISALFFKTVELGRVRIGEMSADIGRLTVVANQLSVPLEEVLSSITQLTIQGVKYHVASTQIRGILLKLIKPTNEMKKLFQELGVSTGEQAIAIHGLNGFMRRLQDYTKGSTTELAKMISRVRGLTGALSLQGQSLIEADRTLEKLKNSYASFEKALEISLADPGKQLERALSRIDHFIKVDLARELLLWMQKATNGFETLDIAVMAFVATVKSALIPVLILAGAAMVPLLIANPILASLGAAAAGIVGLTGTVQYLDTVVQKFVKRSLKDWVKLTRELSRTDFNDYRDEVKKTVEQIENRYKIELERIAELTKFDTKLREDQIRNHRDVSISVENELTKVATLYTKQISSVNADLKKLELAITSVGLEYKKLATDAQKLSFEHSLEGLPNISQINAYTAQIQVAQKQRFDAAQAGDLKTWQLAQSNIQSYFQNVRRLSLAETQSRLTDIVKYSDNAQAITTKYEKRRIKLERERQDLLRDDESVRGVDRQLTNLLNNYQNTINAIARKSDVLDIGGLSAKNARLAKSELATILAGKEKEQLAQSKKLAMFEIEKKLLGNIQELLKSNTQAALNAAAKRGDVEGVQKIIDARDLADKALGELISSQTLFEDAVKAEEVLAILKTRNEEDYFLLRKTNLQQLFEAEAIGLRTDAGQQREKSIGKLRDSLDTAEAFLKTTQDISKVFHTTSDQTEKLTALVSKLDLKRSVLPKGFDFSAFDTARQSLKQFQVQPSPETLQDSRVAIKNLVDAQLQSMQLADGTTLSVEEQTRLTRDLKLQWLKINHALSATKFSTEYLNSLDEIKRKSMDIYNINNAIQQQAASASGFSASSSPAGGSLHFSSYGPGFVGSRLINKSAGGPIHGTDTVPAMLTPDEIVVNAASSRRFYSQLMSMNSWKGYSEGGKVTNSTTVGDINISPRSSGNASIDVISIGKQLRREIRRGTVRLD